MSALMLVLVVMAVRSGPRPVGQTRVVGGLLLLLLVVVVVVVLVVRLGRKPSGTIPRSCRTLIFPVLLLLYPVFFF